MKEVRIHLYFKLCSSPALFFFTFFATTFFSPNSMKEVRIHLYFKLCSSPALFFLLFCYHFLLSLSDSKTCKATLLVFHFLLLDSFQLCSFSLPLSFMVPLSPRPLCVSLCHFATPTLSPLLN